MVWDVAEIVLDALGRVEDREAHFVAARDYRGGPILEYMSRRIDIRFNVVFRFAFGECAGHDYQLPYFPGYQFAVTFHQPCQVRAEAHLHDGHGVVLLFLQDFTQKSDCFRRVGPALQAARIHVAAVGLLTFGGDLDHRAILRRLAVAHHADRNAAAAVETVDERDVGRGPAVVLCDSDGEQPGFAFGFERVDHRQRQRIVYIVSHVGIEDYPHGRGDRTDGKRQGENEQFFHQGSGIRSASSPQTIWNASTSPSRLLLPRIYTRVFRCKAA